MTANYEVIVVGAGFAGLQMLHMLRQKGFNAIALEAADDIGGTWHWNRYPGARCDVESLQYSYQFDAEIEQRWEWHEKYPPQEEILRYAHFVADHLGLRKHIQCNMRVSSARFDEQHKHWQLVCENDTRLSARFVVLATGVLSMPHTPAFAGLDTFEGDIYHTGNWPQQAVDFSGKRVGVIGSGSSAIQAIPLIAQQADKLSVFQRTASYSLPARNRPLPAIELAACKSNYPALRAAQNASPAGMVFSLGANAQSAHEVDADERQRIFERYWEHGGMGFLSSFSDLLFDAEANRYASDFIRSKIRLLVDDAATAEKLCPEQAIGCKRACVDTDYYLTYNRDNVELVSLKDTPIQRMDAGGLFVDDEYHALDVIVMATGFDAITGAVRQMHIEGSNGKRLDQLWAQGANNYLGLAVAGFPNLFTICGPGSPSVLTNMMVSIDQHVNWILRCLCEMRTRQDQLIEATPSAQEDWVTEVNAIANYTLYPSCNSWYSGDNIPGKPGNFMPYAAGIPMYMQRLQQCADNNYEGFICR